jgi:isoleucyl-tRNA synthetase
MITRITDSYRRFRNTFRFMLGNMYDFSPSKDAIPYDQMTPLDQWALSELDELIQKCEAAYNDYEYYKVYHAVNHFFTVDLSATYLDILKDRLYTSKADGVRRRAAQTVLHEILLSLTAILAPIATFLAEEVYGYVPEKSHDSVLLQDFPQANRQWRNGTIKQDFARLLSFREVASKELEEKRQNKAIGASLEAKLLITAGGDDLKLLQKYKPLLREFFIVSEVTVNPGSELRVTSEMFAPNAWRLCREIGKPLSRVGCDRQFDRHTRPTDQALYTYALCCE